MERSSDQYLWNACATVLFVILAGLATWALWTLGRLPIAISVFDFVLVILATFRLIRLFVSDKVFEFVRHPFFDKHREPDEEGKLCVVYKAPTQGIRCTIAHLLSCAWCVGIWAALAVTFFFYLTPLAWYPILFLAVAGAASALRVILPTAVK